MIFTSTPLTNATAGSPCFCPVAVDAPGGTPTTTHARFWIFGGGPGCAVGHRLISTAEIAIGSAGLHAVGVDELLPAGLYYTAILCDAPIMVSGPPASACLSLVPPADAAPNAAPLNGWTATYTYGDLPETLSGLTRAAVSPCVFVRF
jgi:hypothetical protein